MYLIIAEKPSLAKNILAGIAKVQSNEMKKRNGYYEGGSFIVSWVFGHLFSLADIEDYSPTDNPKWTICRASPRSLNSISKEARTKRLTRVLKGSLKR